MFLDFPVVWTSLSSLVLMFSYAARAHLESPILPPACGYFSTCLGGRRSIWWGKNHPFVVDDICDIPILG